METSNYTFEAIGTHWEIDVYQVLTPLQYQELSTRIQDRIELFDRTYSRFRSDSLITKMSQEAGEYELPTDATPLFSLYERLYYLTNGLVTPLIGQTLVDAGYDAEYSLESKTLHKPPAWENVMKYDPPRLTLMQPVLLDVGAAGKGYLIDIIGSLVEESGVHSYCINAGGDILHRNVSFVPIRIGLEHPQDFTQVIGVVNICNQSLCGSAGSRRKWGEFHHIINPFTLSSPQSILAVWVVASSTFLADALTTCLFFVPAATLQKEFQFEYFILKDDYSVERSPGFIAEIFFQ